MAENSIAATIATMKAPVATKIFITDGTGARKLARKKTSSGPRSISSLAPPCGSVLVVVLIRAAVRQWPGQRRADRRDEDHPQSRRRRLHGSEARTSRLRRRGSRRARYHRAWS